MTRTPNLFIIGAPKSGTTSIYEYLKGHPQVFMSPVKEPNYFAPDLADPRDNMLLYGRDEQLYTALFADAATQPILGEGSVRYIYSDSAPQLIKSYQAAPFVVAMLRDPIEMAHSLYRHMVAAGLEDAPSFQAALDAEQDRREGRQLPARMNPRLATYRDRARYGEQLTRWFDTIDRKRILVIVFEEFTARPDVEFRRLLSFLGVDADYQPTEFRQFNAAHAARSARLRRLLNSAPAQWLVWQAGPRLLGDKRTRGLVQRYRNSRMHRRPVQKSAVPADLRSRLEKEFEPDVARLSALLGRDMAQFWFGRQLAQAAPGGTHSAGAQPVSAD